MRTRSLPKIVVIAAVVLFAGLLTTREISRHREDPSYPSWITSLGSRTSGPTSTGRSARAYAKRQVAARSGPKAADKTSSPTPDIRTSCTITGMVSDEQGKPIDAARITIRTSNEAFTKVLASEKSGKFCIEAVPSGTYDILAAHDQYVTLIRPNYTLKPSDQFTTLDFKLPLGTRINGLVTDEEDRPLAEVLVAARRHKAHQVAAGADIYHDDTTYRTQVTDKPGTFTLAGVSAGPNVFEFKHTGFEPEVRKIDISAEKAAEPLKIVLRRTGKLAGLIQDEDGLPVSTATVHLVRYKSFNGPEEKIEKGKLTATSGANGGFSFKKLYTEGYYDLLIEEERYAPGIVPLVAVGSEHIACTLERGGTIEGKVQYIDRAATAAVVLVAAETVVKGTTFTAQAQSDGSGRFDFRHLPYGTYKLYAESMNIVSEPKVGVPCLRDKPTRDVEIEVYEASTVRGRVADGADDKPVPGASVTIKATYGVPRGRTKSFQARADAHGEFELRQLPAGLHSALANARGFRRTVSDRSEQKFTLTPGERKNDLALLLDHGGSVEGFVLGQNGRGVEGCDIQLFAASQIDGRVDANNLKGRTDVTGYFKIWGIEIGERVQLYASARKKGYAKGCSELLDLTPTAPDASTQLVLGGGGVIAGKVTDKNELPVPGAEVKFASSAFPGDPSPSTVIAYSSANGSYSVENCPPGGGSVQVSRSGYVKQSKGVSIKDARVTDRVDFQLDAGYRIAGTVSGLDGKPIAGARVKATGVNGASGSDEDVTDKTGKFELSNLGQGRFELDASFKLPTPDGEQQYRFVKSAVPVGSTGVAVDCDVANSAAGRVEGDNGKGVGKFTLTLRSRSDTQPSQDFTFNLDRAMSNAKGYYRVLNIPRGVYSVQISAEGYEPHRAPDVAIGPHQRTDFPPVRLRAAGGVTGSVISSSTKRPVNNAQIRLVDIALPVGDAAVRACAGTSDYSGVFRISSVPPGTYRVHVDHPSYLGSKFDNITVTRKKQTDLGEVYLEAGGAVRGSIADDQGNPVPNVSVKISGLTPAKLTTTDQAGNYLLQGVQSGRWSIVARGALNARSVYAYTTVHVQRDYTEKANITLDTSADLEGTLASADAPVKSGTIFLHPFDENHVVLEDIHYDTNASSQRFSLKQVPAGQYFLWAAGYGAVGTYQAFRDLFLNRGHNEVTLEMPRAAVRGTLMNGLGEGMPQLGVQLRPVLQNLRLPQALYNKLIKSSSSTNAGAFGFDYLQTGMYQLLHQMPQGNWYAQPPFSVTNGEVLGGYDIVLDQ
ncbi:MAG: carboxypeptidase regulatory-like domain-containing protein [Candidatus Sumerlaeaceae bacterium]